MLRATGLALILISLIAAVRVDLKKARQAKTPFIIAVVGKGPPECKDQSARNYSQNSCGMRRGVEAALTTDILKQEAGHLFSIEPYDDKGTPEGALEVARLLQANQRVLAVIGHSTSQTTRVGAQLYSEAGIPFLVPIATSPDASVANASRFHLFDRGYNSGTRFANFFRLIPNDDLGQAPALVFMSRNVFHANRIAIVADFTNNPDYVCTLYAAAKREFGTEVHSIDYVIGDSSKCAFEIPSGTTALNYQAAASSLPTAFGTIPVSDSPPLLLFIGTFEGADHLLPLLQWPQPPLNVLLTDGAKNLRESRSISANLNIFVLFPAPYISEPTCPSGPYDPQCELQRALYKAFSLPQQQTYETYGFDSMLMLGKALQEICGAKQHCVHELSRAALLRQLQKTARLQGAYSTYLLYQGESVHPEYSLYGLNPPNAMPERDHTLPSATNAVEQEQCRQAVSPTRRYQTATPENRQFYYYCSVSFDSVAKALGGRQ